ncbi:hypothetical protein IFM89_036939 [Coptis chinensis]|uniref:SNF2 N-terminal domain-containing protein n=1 Tax=Coptis chinensis TaxID=261450 RepID=A0A835I027_9MAGN|nr:hypothetical protein IFM89_036939 [Coptis chinensis]
MLRDPVRRVYVDRFHSKLLAKYPRTRPTGLYYPKGILATWKKEFAIWQVEDFPLYDFYSSNALSREEQLMVLKEWVEHKGILFLGTHKTASIVSKSESSRALMACHDILLRVPSILICDEGHTPRNEETDVLRSLAKVRTPRKVVLSGTLFREPCERSIQHPKSCPPQVLEVRYFSVIKSVMSRVLISSGRRQVKAGARCIVL